MWNDSQIYNPSNLRLSKCIEMHMLYMREISYMSKAEMFVDLWISFVHILFTLCFVT